MTHAPSRPKGFAIPVAIKLWLDAPPGVTARRVLVPVVMLIRLIVGLIENVVSARVSTRECDARDRQLISPDADASSAHDFHEEQFRRAAPATIQAVGTEQRPTIGGCRPTTTGRQPARIRCNPTKSCCSPTAIDRVTDGKTMRPLVRRSQANTRARIA